MVEYRTADVYTALRLPLCAGVSHSLTQSLSQVSVTAVYTVQLAALTEKHDKVMCRLSQLQEEVDKLRSLSDTLTSDYDKSTAEVRVFYV